MIRAILPRIALPIIYASLVGMPASADVTISPQAYVKPQNQRADIAAPKRMSNGSIQAHFLRSHNGFVAIARQDTAEVVFLGDSITAGWKKHKALYDQEFGRYNAANFGLGGDRTQHVLWRVEQGEFNGFQPKVVVLMIGANNMSSPLNTAQQIADGIRNIIKAIHQRTPNTKVLLLSLLPRGSVNAETKGVQVNELISRFHDGNRIHYMDIRRSFQTDAGQPSRAAMPDLLHPSALGYRLWADAIRAKLQQLAN